MSLLTAILARNQGSKPLASTETKKYTFDGDLTGKTTVDIESGVIFVKVSDETFTATDFKYLIYTELNSIFNEKFTAEDVVIETEEGTLGIQLDDRLLVVSDTTGNMMGSAGTYVEYRTFTGNTGERTIYVSKIVTEKIHPIDPKYIPGAVLPVVEISTALAEDGSSTELSAEESAKLDEAAKDGIPCIIKAVLSGSIPIHAVYAYGKNGPIVMYVYPNGNTQFLFQKQDGSWSFSIITMS